MALVRDNRLNNLGRAACALGAIVCSLWLGACSRDDSPGSSQAHAATADALDQPNVRVELRSWVVAGHGRHLFAEIIAPPPWEHLSTVVEFWSAAQRDGYTLGDEESARAWRIAKVQRGMRARPPFIEADNRLEAVYTISPRAAMELQRDRMFTNRYLLLGPNSTSGLRAAFLAAGIDFPAHVLLGSGVLGEFPGVDLDPGEEIPPIRWADFGLPQGPESLN